jgi:ABC-type transporter Mla maintaining outer membrane lipid asymmetry ATPase subunit MlaF
VVVTHELESIRTIADRALMLEDRRIIFLGTLDEVEDAADSRVRAFFHRDPESALAAASSARDIES